MQIKSETSAVTAVEPRGEPAVVRLREHAYRSMCTTAWSGNAAVRQVVTEAAELMKFVVVQDAIKRVAYGLLEAPGEHLDESPT